MMDRLTQSLDRVGCCNHFGRCFHDQHQHRIFILQHIHGGFKRIYNYQMLIIYCRII